MARLRPWSTCDRPGRTTKQDPAEVPLWRRSSGWMSSLLAPRLSANSGVLPSAVRRSCEPPSNQGNGVPVQDKIDRRGNEHDDREREQQSLVVLYFDSKYRQVTQNRAGHDAK